MPPFGILSGENIPTLLTLAVMQALGEDPHQGPQGCDDEVAEEHVSGGHVTHGARASELRTVP